MAIAATKNRNLENESAGEFFIRINYEIVVSIE
jgi:hypothetical protein